MTRSIRGALTGIAGVAVVLLAGAALIVVLLNGAARPASPVAAGANPSPAPGASEPAAVGAAVDPFKGCGTLSNRSIRGLTPTELEAIDGQALARAETGWLSDGGPWATGQGWLGDLEGAIAAYGGTRTEAPMPGTWILTERDGEVIGMSLRSVELPSGRTLWLPHNYVIPGECD